MTTENLPPVPWQASTGLIQAINDWAAASHTLARAKGWWDKYLDERRRVNLTPEIVLSKLMLTVTEVAEAAEEVRDGQYEIRFEHPDKGVKYALSPNWAELRNGFKPEGFPIEIADAIIRLLDMAQAAHVDIGYAMAVKLYFNQFRKHRHGGRQA